MERQTGYAYPLALERISVVLAVQIQSDRETALAERPATAHSRNGRRECDLERGAHCQRNETETWSSSIAPNCRKYLHHGRPVCTPNPGQRWLTFVRNHAEVIAACDFFDVVTATFRTLYVFVIMELSSRKILHHNVTAHPTAEWTGQQFREALLGGHAYRFLIHRPGQHFLPEGASEAAEERRFARAGFLHCRTIWHHGIKTHHSTASEPTQTPRPRTSQRNPRR